MLSYILEVRGGAPQPQERSVVFYGEDGITNTQKMTPATIESLPGKLDRPFTVKLESDGHAFHMANGMRIQNFLVSPQKDQEKPISDLLATTSAAEKLKEINDYVLVELTDNQLRRMIADPGDQKVVLLPIYKATRVEELDVDHNGFHEDLSQDFDLTADSWIEIQKE